MLLRREKEQPGHLNLNKTRSRNLVSKMAEDAALDDEFKRVIAEMKPHARSLPQKSDERYKVTLWIKKLLGLKAQRVERNAYAKLLLHMLKVRRLKAPFLDSPPPGSLKMPETMHLSRSPSPNELDSLLMSSPEDVVISHPPLRSHDPGNHGSRVPGTDTSSRQRGTHTHRTTRSNHSTSHTHIMNERRMSPKHGRRTSANMSNPLAHKSKTVHKTAAFSSSLRQSGVCDSGTTASLVHTMVGRGEGWKSEGSGGVMDDKTSVRLWSGDLSSSGVPETSFHPRLTSTLSPSKEGGRKHRAISTDSLDSHLLEQELNLSDVSTNGDVSDVAALLQSRPKPALPQSPTGKGSHFSSYTPRVSFTSPLSQSPRKLDISRELLQAREVELKVKSAETQFQEEKLRIQRHHEDSLKHILDRKNNELEDLRSEHRVKVHQLESQCKKLERKVSQLEWECGQLREQKDHHATEQRQSSHYHRQQLQAEFDKKLHAAITESEREKLSLEQSHSRQLQRVLEESRAQVAKMEAEYSTQTKANSEVIAELEGRVQELTREAESMGQAHSRLAQEKVALERKCSSLETELHETREISSRMEGELAEVRQDRDSQLRQLRNKTEQSVQSLQRQHSIQEARAAEQVTQLEQQVSQWREALEEAKRRHEQQTSELESSHQQQLWDKGLQHEKQVGVLKAEMEQRDLKAREKQLRLESSLRECEDQLVQLRMTQELQSQQAERAIEDFKAQVEHQTNEMFEQMRGELERVEEDLVHSRAQREREARESAQQRQEERQRAEKELSELRLHHDLTVSQLRRDHQCELETLRREQEMAKESALAKLSSTLAEVEAQARAKTTHSTKLISSLDDQVRHLQQQLEERETQHARELVEVKRNLEEEKLTTIRIHESAISKLKSQLERQKAKLREEHRAELDSITHKHSHRVQQLEHDFTMRMAQTSETISSLQSQIKFLQEDLERQKCSYEDQLSTMQQKSEEERDTIKQHHHTIVMSLQQEAEASLTTVTQLEERIAHLQVENESKLSHLKLQYESRMKGMMPLAVKQEYEDTIKSLKAQVNILSQRATILQEELDRRRPSTSRITSTPLPTLTTLTKNITTTTISG